MRNTRVARRYAVALMSAAQETGTLDRTTLDLAMLGTVLRESREFRLFLATPVVSAARKTAVIRELLTTRVGGTTLSFLDLLMEKQREPLLAEIINQYGFLRDRSLGIVSVDVTSAVDLTPQQQQSMQAELERYTRKTVRLRHAVNNAIMGGLVVRIGDTVLDASLTHQLERLRERFARGTSLPH